MEDWQSQKTGNDFWNLTNLQTLAAARKAKGVSDDDTKLNALLLTPEISSEARMVMLDLESGKPSASTGDKLVAKAFKQKGFKVHSDTDTSWIIELPNP